MLTAESGGLLDTRLRLHLPAEDKVKKYFTPKA